MIDQTQKLTPRAQQTLFLARKEAAGLNDNMVGAEHVLLGLILLGQGCAVDVLHKLNVNLEAVRLAIENSFPNQQPQSTREIRFTPGYKKVLALALNEAKAFNHEFLGTEHFLLGLLNGADGIAARILQTQQLDIDRVRQEILYELDPLGMGGSGQRPNLNTNAQQVLALAHKEAAQRGHNVIDTEHLLLGLITGGEPSAVKILGMTGWDLPAIRSEAEKLMTPTRDRSIVGQIPQSPSAIKALALGVSEAAASNRSQSGPAHLLLGLMAEGHGIAAQVLQKVGLTIEGARQKLSRM
jgi:ATP-dependent Clp protease ATP-binding subunit ClpA